MKKFFKSIIVGFALSLCLSFAAYAEEDGWYQDERGWYYIKDNQRLESTWVTETDTGKKYYVDDQGYMRTGWIHDTNTNLLYYFSDSGELVKDQWVDGIYIEPDGKCYFLVSGAGTMLEDGTITNNIPNNNSIQNNNTLQPSEQMSNEPSYIPETTNINSAIDYKTKLAIWGEIQNALASFEAAREKWMMSVDMITADNTTLYALKSQSRFEKTHEHLQRAIGYCSNYPEMFELKSILQKCDNYIISSGILNSIGEFTKGSYRNAVNFGVDVGHMLTETDIMSELEHASSISKSLSN